MPGCRVPSATYRLQLSATCGFAEARALVPYLHALGITDLYVSPFFRARQGSTHGYDVTDHSIIHPEFGTEADLEALAQALQQCDMGLLLDVVPNHMGIGDTSNRWWQDVLENGPSSPYASFFDIDWTPPKQALANKVLLPVLGDQYGRVLEQGEIRLTYEEGAFFIEFYQQRLPVAPCTWTAILEPALEQMRAVLTEDDPPLIELESILTSLRNLPLRTETDPERVRERQREKEVGKRRLASLVAESAPVRSAIVASVAAINGQAGNPESFDGVEALLAEQAYRLCYWRVAADEINYRRFFDINELAAIRVEQPEVFEAVHALVFRLLEQGVVTGLRIDHPDGLFDPEQYFVDLQAGSRQALTDIERSSLPGDDAERSCYVVIEKILAPDERLRAHWAVHGTTGYDFLNLVNDLFVDATGQRQLGECYAQLTGQTQPFAVIAYESRKLILDVSLSSELHVLARRLERIAEQHRWSRDFTLFSLQEALRDVIACFPVYRTYIRALHTVVGEEDRAHITRAIRMAKRRNPAMSASIFDFIATVLLLEEPGRLTVTQQAERQDFVMRFQQLTGPVMAKGVEDTAFYRTYPLLSLNEVGGGHSSCEAALEVFHQRNVERLAQWPHSLLTTMTHDTKRSEDVRARINILSELPDEWERVVQRWQAWNHSQKEILNEVEVPDANEEYLLYQTLVGAWPLTPLDDAARADFIGRIAQYMEKALKEAKIHTSWVNPQEAYDQAVRTFVQRVLSPAPSNRFLTDCERFQARLRPLGLLNALAQVLLKLMAPGVPDIYQGTELWDDSLVDPDNRRPVDFAVRSASLAALQQHESADLLPLVQALLAQWQDGRLKLYVTYKALHFRRSYHTLFQEGAYVPLAGTGARRDHVVAFARHRAQHWALVVVPRLLAGFSTRHMLPVGRHGWGRSALVLPVAAPLTWHNVLTGERLTGTTTSKARTLPLQTILQHCPVALLSGTTDGSGPSC